jgi:plasmid stabilization system protein ParE
LAVAEIDAIADFIARTSSVERAAAFIASVYGRIDALAIFPMSGQPRPKAGARVRSVWSAPVTIFYAVASDESEVVVHHVIVGGRNLEAIFGPAP